MTPLLAGDWSRCGPMRLAMEVLSLPESIRNQKRPSLLFRPLPCGAVSPQLLQDVRLGPEGLKPTEEQNQENMC